MRFLSLSLFMLFLFIGDRTLAADEADNMIIYCEKNSITLEQRIGCLENALRITLPKARKQGRQTQPPSIPQENQENAALSVRKKAEGPLMPQGMGAEQVPLQGKRLEKAKREFRTREGATVVDFALSKNGKLVLVLDNGQVWKQRSADWQTVPLSKGDKPQVEVHRGTISGYRMKFIKQKRTITVSRVK